MSFTLKAGETVRIVGEPLGKNLESNISTQFRVAGAIHLAHAAFPEQ